MWKDVSNLEKLAIAILGRLSRPPGSPDYAMKGVDYVDTDPLARATAVFPDFRDVIAGKRVLDFGCGRGYQAAAMADSGALVTGVDISRQDLAIAKKTIRGRNVKLFESIQTGSEYDVIYSQNSMEHWTEPSAILRLLSDRLASAGRLYITFAPPWYAPYGAHMGFFTKVPWVHLIFPERVVMAVRSRYRNDSANTYSSVALAKMSIRKFESLIRKSGLRILHCRYDAVRGLNFLPHIPMLRELFINRVSCILEKPARASVRSMDDSRSITDGLPLLQP